MPDTNQTKKQKFTLDDRYQEFLARNARAQDTHSNPLNLFDDSNQEDEVWLGIARDYLARER